MLQLQRLMPFGEEKLRRKIEKIERSEKNIPVRVWQREQQLLQQPTQLLTDSKEQLQKFARHSGTQ
jgi:ribosomal protein S19